MTARNISLLGATYSNVPGVTLPVSGGGSATFYEVSDTTAAAADVATGKYFYTADGTKTQGTSSGGGGADLPTIDIAWDSSYTTRTVTCDETFSECWDRYYNGNTGVYVHTHDDFGWEENTTAVVGDAIGSDYIAYVVSGSYGPVYDIMYYPNGTMTVVEPSAFAENLSVTANGEYYPSKGVYTSVNVNVSGGGSPNLQDKTVSPSESQQTVQADSGYDGLDTVTVNAVSSTYVGSGITRRSSTDLTASGATVSVPSGYYQSSASKSVASGTAGTPTATKGTVSNHSVSVTPSVTNTTGYITGSTKTGTAVTVSASELVSGDKSITENGNNIDVANYSTVSVNVSGGDSKNAQVVQGTTRTTSSTLTAIGAELTVSKTGTYDVYWSGVRTTTSGSYTYGTQLYINGTAHGTQNTTWSNHVQNNHLSNVSLTQGQKLRVYGRNSRGSSYYIYAPTLVIIEV